MSMYEKVKREVVLWLGFVAVVLVALAEVADVGWVGPVAVAVLAGLARFKVTPVSDPRDNDGNPLV